MKKILLLTTLLVSGLVYSSTDAQIRVNAQINISNQPDWGPAGYDYVKYYYLPEANAYYDVAAKRYIYQERGRWMQVKALPFALRNINLYNSYKVVINDRSPWLKHDRYKKQYGSMKHRQPQLNWRDSRNNSRYEVAKNDRRDGMNNRNNRNDRNNNNKQGGYRH